MTLLELLCQELPKRGGWPKHAEKYCSYNGKAGAYKRGGIEIKKALITGIDAQICEVVYAEQYEAALAEQPEASEEDLNDCIGYAPSTVWNGEGLPPVGMEIEYNFAKVNYRTNFSRGKVLAYGIHNVFMEHWASKNEFIQPLDKINFRPLRTEAERAIDEMVRLSGVSIGAAKILYDAGYRK